MGEELGVDPSLTSQLIWKWPLSFYSSAPRSIWLLSTCTWMVGREIRLSFCAVLSILWEVDLWSISRVRKMASFAKWHMHNLHFSSRCMLRKTPYEKICAHGGNRTNTIAIYPQAVYSEHPQKCVQDTGQHFIEKTFGIQWEILPGLVCPTIQITEDALHFPIALCWLRTSASSLSPGTT